MVVSSWVAQFMRKAEKLSEKNLEAEEILAKRAFRGESKHGFNDPRDYAAISFFPSPLHKDETIKLHHKIPYEGNSMEAMLVRKRY